MEREREGQNEKEREREQKRERDGEIERGGGAHRVSHLSVHQWACVTATSRSYKFLIFENSAAALCGTTCIRDPKIKQNAQTICAAEEFEKKPNLHVISILCLCLCYLFCGSLFSSGKILFDSLRIFLCFGLAVELRQFMAHLCKLNGGNGGSSPWIFVQLLHTDGWWFTTWIRWEKSECAVNVILQTTEMLNHVQSFCASPIYGTSRNAKFG